MDEADRGNDYMEKWLNSQITKHQNQLNQMGAFEIGRCRNCDERIDDGRAFCDLACREDFDDRMRANKRNGKYRGG